MEGIREYRPAQRQNMGLARFTAGTERRFLYSDRKSPRPRPCRGYLHLAGDIARRKGGFPSGCAGGRQGDTPGCHSADTALPPGFLGHGGSRGRPVPGIESAGGRKAAQGAQPESGSAVERLRGGYSRGGSGRWRAVRLPGESREATLAALGRLTPMSWGPQGRCACVIIKDPIEKRESSVRKAHSSNAKSPYNRGHERPVEKSDDGIHRTGEKALPGQRQGREEQDIGRGLRDLRLRQEVRREAADRKPHLQGTRRSREALFKEGLPRSGKPKEIRRTLHAVGTGTAGGPHSRTGLTSRPYGSARYSGWTASRPGCPAKTWTFRTGPSFSRQARCAKRPWARKNGSPACAGLPRCRPGLKPDSDGRPGREARSVPGGPYTTGFRRFRRRALSPKRRDTATAGSGIDSDPTAVPQ